MAAGDSLAEEERVSTHWGLADDMAAGAGRPARRETVQTREKQEQMMGESYEDRQRAGERSETLRESRSSDDLPQVETRGKKAGEHRCQSDQTCGVHPGQSMAFGGHSRG